MRPLYMERHHTLYSLIVAFRDTLTLAAPYLPPEGPVWTAARAYYEALRAEAMSAPSGPEVLGLLASIREGFPEMYDT